MDTLTTILLILMASTVIILPIIRMSDLSLWAARSRKILTELKTSIGRIEPNHLLALCDGDYDTPAERIVRAVLSRADKVRGPAHLRAGLLRLICDQAAARESQRIKRGVPALRTIAIVSGPIGAIATAWDTAAIGLSWMCDAGPCLSRPGLSESLSFTIAGSMIALGAFITYKYLSAKIETESANLRDLSAMLLLNYNART
jgi:biopolymer transport protein ExbB/TolQ